jgi:hypothetical protein
MLTCKIWKRSDVKSYEFDSQGEMIAELGVAVITNYKFVFIPNIVMDEKDIIAVPLLQIYKVSRVGDLDSKPPPGDARGKVLSTAASVVTSSKQLLSESKQKIIQTKNSVSIKNLNLYWITPPDSRKDEQRHG